MRPEIAIEGRGVLSPQAVNVVLLGGFVVFGGGVGGELRGLPKVCSAAEVKRPADRADYPIPRACNLSPGCGGEARCARLVISGQVARCANPDHQGPPSRQVFGRWNLTRCAMGLR